MLRTELSALPHEKSTVPLTDRADPAADDVPADRDGQLQQLDGIEAVRRLVARFGYHRVRRWTRLVATQEGQEIE